MVVLDFYLVAKYGNTLDDGLNELVFLDGIHEVPDGVEVRKGFADLFRGKVATVLVHTLRFRENPITKHLLAPNKEKTIQVTKTI